MLVERADSIDHQRRPRVLMLTTGPGAAAGTLAATTVDWGRIAIAIIMNMLLLPLL